MDRKVGSLFRRKSHWDRLNLTCMELRDEGVSALAKLMTPGKGKGKGKVVHVTTRDLCLANNEITIDGLTDLAKALNGGQVQSLNLAGNFMAPRAAKVFALSLQDSAPLKKLNLARNPLKDEGTIELAYGVAASGLHELDLRGCGVEEDGVSRLVEMLPKTLQVLTLAENVVGERGAASLAMILPETGVQELYLYSASLGAEGASALADRLVSWNGKKLNLCHNGIGNDGAISLAKEWLGKESCGVSWLSLTSNGIGPEGAKHVAKALARNASIIEMRLSRNDIGSCGLEALCKALAHNQTLKTLSLNRSSLREDGASIIGHALPAMCVVEHLALQHNEFGDAGVQALATGLCKNSSVKGIELGSNNIANEGAVAIAGVLHERQGFKCLLLDRNHIDDDGVDKIANAIRNHENLAEISLRKNKFGNCLESTIWGGFSFASALRQNASLTSVDLSRNKIYMQGAEEFAAAAKDRHDNGFALSLNISYCYIGSTGAMSLAPALGMNGRLRELLIDGNEIGDKGVSSISNALTGNTDLEHLCLSFNQIGNVGARSLSKALPSTRIRFLDLDDNEIGDDGAKQLAHGAEEMECLAEFRIRRNPIQADACRSLRKSAWSNAERFRKSPPKIRVPTSLHTSLQMPGLAVDDREGIDSFRKACELLQADADTPGHVFAQEEEDVEHVLLQTKLIKALLPGAGQYDPAQNPRALAAAKKKGLLRRIDVRYIRFGHDTVSQVFCNGPHSGQAVGKLLDELIRGKSVDEVTPLVVVTLAGENWIVFGNRRLKCLKQLAEDRSDCVLMNCIAYDWDQDRDLPICLLAKLLHGATTENDGVSVRFRRGKHEESYHSASSHSEAVRQAIMSAPRRQHEAEAACEVESGGKCFKEHTLLEDVHGCFRKVELVKENEEILGESGRAVRVLSKRIHPAENQELVELHAGTAHLIVSTSHRVMVNRSRSGPEAAPAGSLREGDDVVCRGAGVQQLTKVRSFHAVVKLVEFQFDPDISVAAFHAPDMIMSKGRGRGRSQARSTREDVASIPDTELEYAYPEHTRQSRPQSRLHKTRLCNYYSNSGQCSRGSACGFAHGVHELRAGR